MAQTFKRLCVQDYLIEDDDGVSFTIHRGREYITSPEREGQVRVYSTYWVWVPASLFAGPVEFTPASQMSKSQADASLGSERE